MTKEGQQRTQATYLDPEVVRNYAEGARRSKMLGAVDAFAARLPGTRRVIDIGCGPGQHAYRFADNGCHVTALDSSPTMVAAARVFRQVDQSNSPTFQVADMRDIGTLSPEDSFEGAWVSDSLFHVPEEEVPDVLRGIHTVVVNNGPVFIALKEAEEGEQVTREVEEHKYGKDIVREFTFWEEAKFRAEAEKNGFIVESVERDEMGITEGKPTKVVRFMLSVTK